MTQCHVRDDIVWGVYTSTVLVHIIWENNMSGNRIRRGRPAGHILHQLNIDTTVTATVTAEHLSLHNCTLN